MKILLLAGLGALVIALGSRLDLSSPVMHDDLRWAEGLVIDSPK